MSPRLPAQFNVCERYGWILQQHNKTDFDIGQDLKEYARCAQSDLNRLLGFGFKYFFPLAKNVRDDIKVSIDIYDYRVFAKVVKIDSEFEVVISIGTILAIDDAVSILMLRLFPSVEPIANNYKYVKGIDTRFYNYSFLLDESFRTKRLHPFYTICPVVYDRFEQIEFRAIVSNFSILWIFLHELAHIQLGHFDRLKKGLINFQFSEFFYDSVNGGPGSNQAFGDMMVYEFAADYYANLKWFVTFFRRDAVSHIFPSMAKNNPEAALLISILSVGLPSILLHRAQESFFMDSIKRPTSHPVAPVRLFNSMAICSISLRHVELLLNPLLKHVMKADLTINIDFVSLGMVYFEVIPILDWLLGEMGCQSLLPRVLNSKVSFWNYLFNKTVDKETIKREMNELVVALLASPYTGSKWSSISTFRPYHEEWKAILNRSIEFWKDEIKFYGPWSQEKLWQFAFENDLEIPVTYQYFATISNNLKISENEKNIRETAVEEASEIVNFLVNLKAGTLNKNL